MDSKLQTKFDVDARLFVFFWIHHILVPHNYPHRQFFSGSLAARIGRESSTKLFRGPSLWKCRVFRAISSFAIKRKTSSMFRDCLAEVSKTASRPNFSANVQASSNRICRFSTRSDLLPKKRQWFKSRKHFYSERKDEW